jgi:hypothetical protein
MLGIGEQVVSLDPNIGYGSACKEIKTFKHKVKKMTAKTRKHHQTGGWRSGPIASSKTRKMIPVPIGRVPDP